MTKSIFIGINGRRGIGKTTMLNHILDNYLIGNGDPGYGMKGLYVLNKSDSAEIDGLMYVTNPKNFPAYVVSLLRTYVSDYETLKRKATDPDQFRKDVIGFAEIPRVFFPDYWVVVTKMMGQKLNDVFIGEILNESELAQIKKHYDEVVVVNLNCLNPYEDGSTGDSRQPITDKALLHMSYDYVLEDSLKVADDIITIYNKMATNANLPLVEKI